MKTDNIDSDHFAILWNSALLDFVVEHATNASWTGWRDL
jgi:hypothetical protein